MFFFDPFPSTRHQTRPARKHTTWQVSLSRSSLRSNPWRACGVNKKSCRNAFWELGLGHIFQSVRKTFQRFHTGWRFFFFLDMGVLCCSPFFFSGMSFASRYLRHWWSKMEPLFEKNMFQISWHGNYCISHYSVWPTPPNSWPDFIQEEKV